MGNSGFAGSVTPGLPGLACGLMLEILKRTGASKRFATVTCLRECFYGPEQLPADFKKFIKSLNDSDVHYLLLGGWAIGLYGNPQVIQGSG